MLNAAIPREFVTDHFHVNSLAEAEPNAPDEILVDPGLQLAHPVTCHDQYSHAQISRQRSLTCDQRRGRSAHGTQYVPKGSFRVRPAGIPAGGRRGWTSSTSREGGGRVAWWLPHRIWRSLSGPRWRTCRARRARTFSRRGLPFERLVCWEAHVYVVVFLFTVFLSLRLAGFRWGWTEVSVRQKNS